MRSLGSGYGRWVAVGGGGCCTANEMCWLPSTTSNSCRPFLSGSGQFLSSSLRARSAGVGASQAHLLPVAVGGGSRWAATGRAGRGGGGEGGGEVAAARVGTG